MPLMFNPGGEYIMANRRSIFEDNKEIEQAGSAKIEHKKRLSKQDSENKKINKATPVDKREYVLNGDKLLKIEVKGGRKYRTYIGNVRKDPSLKERFREKGII